MLTRTLKSLPLLLIFLMAFTLTLPEIGDASSDPSWWWSNPTIHHITMGFTVSNPEYAYDNNTGTGAGVVIDTGGSFEVIDFSKGAQTSNDIIAMVDLYMDYDIAKGGKCSYKIWFYIDPNYQANPLTFKILVDFNQDAHSGTQVWKDIKDPSDLTWSWADILNLRVVVTSGLCGGGGAKTLSENEVWLKIYYYNSPTLYVDPTSTTRNSGETFSIDVNITGFTAGNWSGGVYGWEFKLGYNGTLLNATSIVGNGTGKFLDTGQFFLINFSDTLGVIWATCSLTGDVHGKTGDGILATIGFSVKTTGSCNLTLNVTKLSGYDYPNKRVYAIAHTAIDGIFQTAPPVPEFPYGAALEIGVAVVIVYALWTRRRKRKLNNSPHSAPFSVSRA